MKLSVKITIVRAIMYIDDFFVTSKSICNFIFSQFGIFFCKTITSILIKIIWIINQRHKNKTTTRLVAANL